MVEKNKKQLTVARQLSIGFGFVLALLVLMGGLSLYELDVENGHVVALRDNWMPSVRASLQIRNAMADVRLTEFRLVDATTPDDIADASHRMDARVDDAKKSIDDYRPLISEPDEAAAFSRVESDWGKYLQVNRQLRQLKASGQDKDAFTLLATTGSAIRDAINKNVQQMVDINVDGARRAGTSADVAFRRAIVIVLAVIVLSLVCSTVIALSITRRLVRQLGGEPHEAAAIAREISEGNLAIDVSLRASDSSSLLFALSQMQARLRSIVSNIKVASDTISAAATEISAGNGDLSARTEEQAASLEETASSMEQLSSTVRQNADNARRAVDMSRSSAVLAERGGVEVLNVANTMREIEVNSEKVGQITAVIEGIAFQTNILALNAAVEAARAGSHGRGFAVVAAEVRALSQRSASAAREINALIRESASAIATGVDLVGHTGRTMAEIVTATNHTLVLLQEVSTASDEQSAGITQVDTAIAQLDQVTQQNASLVEESAAATYSLASQAQALQTSVAVFRER